MTFEQYPICKINDSVRIISKRFDKKISSNVSSELSQEIKEITGTILDAAYKIYSYLDRDDCSFAEFDEINKSFNDNAHNEEWSYSHTGNKLKDLYNEVAKHNTMQQITSNQNLYGREDIANYLMDISTSCQVCLDKQRDAQEHRRQPTIRFKDPSSKTLPRERTVSLSGSSNDSHEKDNESASL